MTGFLEKETKSYFVLYCFLINFGLAWRSWSINFPFYVSKKRSFFFCLFSTPAPRIGFGFLFLFVFGCCVVVLLCVVVERAWAQLTIGVMVGDMMISITRFEKTKEKQ